jgi:hypothetical protein
MEQPSEPTLDTLEEALQRILVILVVAEVSLLAVASIALDAISRVVIYIVCIMVLRNNICVAYDQEDDTCMPQDDTRNFDPRVCTLLGLISAG